MRGNGPLGGQTQVVNGQLVNTPNVEAYLPATYAPVAPAQLWQSMAPATVPPSVQAALAAAPTQPRGGSPMPADWTGAPDTAMGWLHPGKYPVLPAILLLVLGLLALRFIHWRA